MTPPGLCSLSRATAACYIVCTTLRVGEGRGTELCWGGGGSSLAVAQGHRTLFADHQPKAVGGRQQTLVSSDTSNCGLWPENKEHDRYASPSVRMVRRGHPHPSARGSGTQNFVAHINCSFGKFHFSHQKNGSMGGRGGGGWQRGVHPLLVSRSDASVPPSVPLSKCKRQVLWGQSGACLLDLPQCLRIHIVVGQRHLVARNHHEKSVRHASPGPSGGAAAVAVGFVSVGDQRSTKGRLGNPEQESTKLYTHADLQSTRGRGRIRCQSPPLGTQALLELTFFFNS